MKRPAVLFTPRQLQKALRTAQTLFSRAQTAKDQATVLCITGGMLHAHGRFCEAMTQYQRALALDPDSAEAHVELAALQLRNGEYEQGWQNYEWRFLAY